MSQQKIDDMLVEYALGKRNTFPSHIYIYVYHRYVIALLFGLFIIITAAIIGNRIRNRTFMHDFVYMALYTDFCFSSDWLEAIWERDLWDKSRMKKKIVPDQDNDPSD